MPATHVHETDDGRFVTTRELVLEMLAVKDWEAGPLAFALGLHKNTVGNALEALREKKLCYRVRWRRQRGTRGKAAIVYRIGWGKEAEMPKKTRASGLADDKRYREKHKVVIAVKRSMKTKNGLGIYRQLIT